MVGHRRGVASLREGGSTRPTPTLKRPSKLKPKPNPRAGPHRNHQPDPDPKPKPIFKPISKPKPIPKVSLVLEIAHNKEMKKMQLVIGGTPTLFWLQGRKQVTLTLQWFQLRPILTLQWVRLG